MVMTAERVLNILVIEDDHETAAILFDLLEQSGYRAVVALNAAEALSQLAIETPDLVLLDLRLPDMDGLALLSKVRSASQLPLIVVSGKGTDRDRVSSLENGADDYIAKPFSSAELVARVRALMRRVEWGPTADSRLVVGRLELDIPRRRALIRGRKIHLTPIEYNLLHALMRSAGQTVTYNELLRSVWGDNYTGDFSVLRVNISRLRQKIEEDKHSPACIVTVAGEGYMMSAS
jgi:two-component system KDP operon response regulator KdpE